jgi:hypothetical protein
VYGPPFILPRDVGAGGLHRGLPIQLHVPSHLFFNLVIVRHAVKPDVSDMVSRLVLTDSTRRSRNCVG